MTDSKHRYALTSGHRLGKYRIERFLGAGAFGITYVARETDRGRRVAIKEYLPDEWALRQADDSVAVKTKGDEEDFLWGLGRFEEEAHSLSRFDHPSIVGVYDYFAAHATGYLVMEYIEGETLGGFLSRCHGNLTEAQIERSVLPILKGLAQVHRAGLLHRDIKPSNIVLRNTAPPSANPGTPVLIDFGAARHAIGAKTRTVTSLVTQGYSPLEQYSTNARQTAASDLYAFCAVLYRCVTGRAPTEATDRSLGTPLVPAHRAAERIYSDGLLRGIDAGLALRMADRPKNIGELRTILVGGADIRKGRRTHSQQSAQSAPRSHDAASSDQAGAPTNDARPSVPDEPDEFVEVDGRQAPGDDAKSRSTHEPGAMLKGWTPWSRSRMKRTVVAGIFGTVFFGIVTMELWVGVAFGLFFAVAAWFGW